MTTTNITWEQPNMTDIGRTSAEWYKWGGSDPVAHVNDNYGRTVVIYADGEMRYHIYQANGTTLDHVGTVRYMDQFAQFGITTDTDLFDLPEAEWPTGWNGYNTLKGPNKDGYYLEEINNPWFDLYLYESTYQDAEHLDNVCFDINEAVDAAINYLTTNHPEGASA